VTNFEIDGSFIGDASVIKYIQEIEINSLRCFVSIKPVLCHAADTAATAVLKNNLWILGRFYFYLFELVLIQ
jgi:hypothetical protein